MSIEVPGVGTVLIRWMPASDEDYRDKSEGARGGYPPIAIVHHRAVSSSLHGIDRTFAAGDADPATVGSPGRPVSAHFAIGTIAPNVIAISQYVDLSDTAYCNGDCQQYPIPPSTTLRPPSEWDNWYGHYGHNERTVSIEHDDNGGSSDPAARGIVEESIILTSIELDRLLLTGDIAAIRAAGIRIRDQATADALGAIVPGPRTLIDHRNIAGSKKPYCWRPWQADKIGFPRARYIAALTEGEVLPISDTAQKVVTARTGTVYYDPGTGQVVTKESLASRTIPSPYASGGYRLVSIPTGGTVKLLGVKPADPAVTITDPPATFSKAQVDAARAKGIAEAAAAAGAVR